MPYGFVRVRKGCVAISDTVTLTGTYEHGSSHKIHNDALDMLKNYNFSNIKIWVPFKIKMPNLRGVVRLPKKLKHLKEVPLKQFFEGLSNQSRSHQTCSKQTFSLMGIFFDYIWNCNFGFHEHSGIL